MGSRRPCGGRDQAHGPDLLRDGSACGQAEAAERLALNPSLLYPTRDEAVRASLARLRVLDAATRAR